MAQRPLGQTRGGWLAWDLLWASSPRLRGSLRGSVPTPVETQALVIGRTYAFPDEAEHAGAAAQGEASRRRWPQGQGAGALRGRATSRVGGIRQHAAARPAVGRARITPS